jgi:site-specific DNA-methyltransferase (adenine-specific)
MGQDSFLEYFNIINNLTKYVYEDTNLLHIEALTKVFNYINGIEEDIEFEQNEELFLNEIQKLDDISLEKNSLLNAIQILILNCLKEDNLNMSLLIPNKISVFMGYILQNLNKKQNIRVMDPNITTGNLLLNATSNIDNVDIEYFGVDMNPILVNLSKAIFNMLDIDIKLYLQDPLTVASIIKTDYVLSNVESYYLEDNKYYPYEFIKKYSKNLKDNGYMILLLDDNFFKNRELMDFKAEINEELKMQGIISLPKSLFKTRLKHIVIFQKTKVEIKKFLICEMPEFENTELFNQSLAKLNNWLKEKGEELCKK